MRRNEVPFVLDLVYDDLDRPSKRGGNSIMRFYTSRVLS